MSDDFSESGDSVSGGDFGGDFGSDSDSADGSLMSGFGNDSVTEVTSTSWLSRLGNAIVQTVFGMILFAASFVVLFWNEGRAVHRAQDLAEGDRQTQVITSDSVDPNREGQLVFTTGQATSGGDLTDDLFQLTVPHALKLRRTVEMYQWKETKTEKKERQTGGSERTITTYDYSKGWHDELINSSNFHKPQGHENPNHKPVEGQLQIAPQVTLGGFTLPAELAGQLDHFEPITYSEKDWNRLPVETQHKFRLRDSRLYTGKSLDTPVIGDARITFSAVKPTPVSIVATQTQSTFAPFTTHRGGTLYEIRTGILTREAFFQRLNQENHLLLWILRAVGWGIMFLGIVIVLNPIKVFADFIPLLGTISGMGIGLFALLVSAALSLVTIAAGWIVYRPLLGITLLAGSIGLFILLGRRLNAQRRKQGAMA